MLVPDVDDRLREPLGQVYVGLYTLLWDQDEAMMLSDRIVLMNQGRIVQIGLLPWPFGEDNAMFTWGYAFGGEFYRPSADPLLPGEDPAQAKQALDYARQLLPGSQDVALLLARMHARMGHSTQARELVVAVLSRTHSRAIRREAEQVLGVIDGTIATRTILKGPGAEKSK
jgi:ABC-type sulfate/molybdate transport systems ATPase subunit